MKNTNFLVAHSTLTNTIYAGTTNDDKTEWVDKSDVTKEAIEAVRDYAVQKLVDKYYADSKGNPDCVHPSTMSFQWNRKDGAVVTLSVHVELPKTIPLDGYVFSGSLIGYKEYARLWTADFYKTYRGTKGGLYILDGTDNVDFDVSCISDYCSVRLIKD